MLLDRRRGNVAALFGVPDWRRGGGAETFLAAWAAVDEVSRESTAHAAGEDDVDDALLFASDRRRDDDDRDALAEEPLRCGCGGGWWMPGSADAREDCVLAAWLSLSRGPSNLSARSRLSMSAASAASGAWAAPALRCVEPATVDIDTVRDLAVEAIPAFPNRHHDVYVLQHAQALRPSATR
jgi:hypothetical protein